MKKFLFVSTFIIILSISLLPHLLFESAAIENSILPPKKQWKISSQIELISCKDGFLLLQKYNGSPACVSASTYISLIDRGYGKFDSEIMMKRPTMMNKLTENMISNQIIMNHWHEMMVNDKTLLNKTMSNWIASMKENKHLLANMMGPITNDPNLREKMITQMKQHDNMMKDLQNHHKWMDSVHDDMMNTDMGIDMDMNTKMEKEMHQQSCPWCPKYEKHISDHHPMNFSNSSKMMDMIHHMWINDQITVDIHNFMLTDPNHMAQMVHNFLSPMLKHMMDDPEIRQEMIEMMLENHEFMNSVRHENRSSD